MKFKTIKKCLFNPKLGWNKMTDKFTILIRLNNVFVKKKVLSKMNKHPVIYVRTPKVASISILLALKESGRLVNMLDKRNQRKDFLKNMDLSDKFICVGAYKNRIWFQKKYPEIWENSFKWAVVRNPYDKCISAWKYLENTSGKTLSEILTSPPNEEENFSDYLHFTRTQSETLSTKGKVYVNFILKYENLVAEWIKLEDELGIKLPELPVVNKTASRVSTHSTDSLSQDEKKMIQDRYKLDFENFGYSK